MVHTFPSLVAPVRLLGLLLHNLTRCSYTHSTAVYQNEKACAVLALNG